MVKVLKSIKIQEVGLFIQDHLLKYYFNVKNVKNTLNIERMIIVKIVVGGENGNRKN
tara:strand:- start:4047 stop:4217 length:171 start_codon:yes stop_codon:yes gene_type:complete